jgi:hypothetical protein
MDLYELFAILFFASCGIIMDVSFGYCIDFSASNEYKCSFQTNVRIENHNRWKSDCLSKFWSKKRKIIEVIIKKS